MGRPLLAPDEAPVEVDEGVRELGTVAPHRLQAPAHAPAAAHHVDAEGDASNHNDMITSPRTG